MKGYRLLVVIALMTLGKNVAGQQYTAWVDSTETEEAVPVSLVRQFQHLTADKGDSLTSNVYWMTGALNEGTRFYYTTFDYRLANGTAVPSRLEFEWNDAGKVLSVWRRNMPVGTDTLPRRMRRVLQGKISRHCRKYGQAVAYVKAFSSGSANEHARVVRCEVHLLDREPPPPRPHKADYEIKFFTISADGSIRKSFGMFR
ncbi:hypothetical protein GCM10023185_27450 [Hymenobacter saemangeumensis]|uniref:DUF3108 domain-containing protein n=1 Tax=Hymenobacter saemangeumensis TaxID=1084522 RepID=A0ABP8IJT5_9BACT